MSIFNSIYYYMIPYQPDQLSIKVRDQNDYHLVSNTEKIEHTTDKEDTNMCVKISYDPLSKIEIFTIEDKNKIEDTDISARPLYREFTPDTMSTLENTGPENLENTGPENVIKIDNTFENKTVEEIIEYYENKMKIEKLALDDISLSIKIIERKCDHIIMLLFILCMVVSNSRYDA